MLKLNKAAILIAVFLLLTINGCYTKLKSPNVKIIPENPDEAAEQPRWDFGWGWYDHSWSDYYDYYGYYYVSWWDECRWCGDEEEVDIHLFNNLEKIKRRDNEYVPGAYQTGYSNYNNQPVSVEVRPPVQPSADPQPIIQSKSASGGSDNNDSNSTNNGNKKIKKRSRR